MTTTTAIASDTAAGSADVVVADGASIQVWTVPNLAVGESVAIYRYDSSDTVEAKVIDKGEAVGVTRECGNVVLNGPGNFRLKKSVTATATAVYYDA